MLLAGLLDPSAAPAGAATKPSPTPTPDASGLPAAGSPERRMLEALNAERVRLGLNPLAWSVELGAAARAHGVDQALNGYFDHEGLDGSSPQERAARHGYVVPRGTGWLVIEALSAMPSMEAALGWLLGDSLHRGVLLRPVWREVGISYVSGGPYGHLWTLDFGCRPNLLPVFAAAQPDGEGLTLTLTNEQCASYGNGPDQMGRATEVQISTARDLKGGAWEPYAEVKQVPRPDHQALAVRLRDGSGRESAPMYLLLERLADEGLIAGSPVAPTPTSKPTKARRETAASD